MLIEDFDGGYIKCDVCGDHRIQISVYRNEHNRYALRYASVCYGSEEFGDLDHEEAADRLMELRHTVHIQRTISAIHRFAKKLRRGAYNVKVESSRPTIRVTSRPPSEWAASW